MITKIPKEYRTEFVQTQTSLIKNRVALLCGAAIGIYLFQMVIGFVVFPEDFQFAEFQAAIFLCIGGFAVLVLNRGARTLVAAKLNAYLFLVFALAVITKLLILYHTDTVHWSVAVYVYILLFVSFIIPWRPAETILLTALVTAAYSVFFLHMRRIMPADLTGALSFKSYFEGSLFIYMAFALSVIVRRKETVREIENFTLLKEVEVKNAQMQRELELATKVHKTLVPRSLVSDRADIAVLYLPAYYLSGDYAKFHFIDQNRLIFIICDVTGHGVSAALLVNRLHAEFEDLTKLGKDPGVLLKDLNRFIIKDFGKINMYLSAFCGMLDFNRMSFTYSNHGHPTQYFYKVTESKIVYLGSQATLLGLSSGEEEVHQREIAFNSGDKIFLFTDGVIEARNSKGEEYGKARLEEFIRMNHRLKVDEFNQVLLDEMHGFRGEQFADDIFVLTIEIKQGRL